MKVHRFLGALLLVWLSATMATAAQPTKAQRELFDQTKAQADKGDAEAQLRLGVLYGNGIGTSKDLRKAAKWHRKAADQGLAQAQFQLGLDYSEGEGLKPDDVEATKWFHKAAEQGLAEAELQLGLCYLRGNGVRVNGTEAINWIRRAAAHGLAGADYELGKCYLEGTGVARDITEGIKWVRQAAERGDASAQNRLGLAYQKGEAVPKDYVQAYKWFALAAAQDDVNANDIRVSLAKTETLLTKEQVAEAQRLAREFKPAQGPGPRAAGPGAGQTNSVGSTSAPAGTSNLGFVSVKAGDDHSEVFVDGAFVGNPPARLKLTQGAHIIEVKQTGFKDYRKEVMVAAGSDLSLQVVLSK